MARCPTCCASSPRLPQSSSVSGGAARSKAGSTSLSAWWPHASGKQNARAPSAGTAFAPPTSRAGLTRELEAMSAAANSWPAKLAAIKQSAALNPRVRAQSTPGAPGRCCSRRASATHIVAPLQKPEQAQPICGWRACPLAPRPQASARAPSPHGSACLAFPPAPACRPSGGSSARTGSSPRQTRATAAARCARQRCAVHLAGRMR